MDMEHERRITEVEERSKSNTRRLERVEAQQTDLSKLVSTVAVLAEREKNVETNVEEIKEKVNTLTEKPAKRWENLIAQIISILVAAVIGFFIAKIGL